MSKFPEFKKYADMFSAPALNAEFVFYAGGACSAEAALVAGGATFDLLGADADARNFRVRLSYDGTRGTDSLSVSASAENFSREKFPSFENVSARAGVVFDGGYVGLENVEIAAKKISYDGTDIGNVAVSKSSLDTAKWRGGAGFRQAWARTGSAANFRFRKKDACASVSTAFSTRARCSPAASLPTFPN